MQCFVSPFGGFENSRMSLLQTQENAIVTPSVQPVVANGTTEAFSRRRNEHRINDQTLSRRDPPALVSASRKPSICPKLPQMLLAAPYFPSHLTIPRFKHVWSIRSGSTLSGTPQATTNLPSITPLSLNFRLFRRQTTTALPCARVVSSRRCSIPLGSLQTVSGSCSSRDAVAQSDALE